MRFDGRVVIVTGGARGIGRAIGTRFANEGATIAVCDVNGERAEAAASEMSGTGGDAIGLEVDVTKSEDVHSAVKKIRERFGRIDVLVNNAGITISKPVLDFEEDEWARTFDINLVGVIRCSKVVGKVMVEQNYGRIINIASEAGKTAKPDFTIYAASKFGVVGFTQGFAQELAQFGVTVNAVCPGIVETEMWRELDRVLSKRQGLKEGEVLEGRKRMIPLGRLQQPEDVAGVVAFLASDDASYMTGQAVNVTGGREFH